MPTIYILGSSGYIGGNLLSFLQRKGKAEVVTVGRNGCDLFVDLGRDHSALVKNAKRDDVVVFLSSVSSPDICAKQPDLAYEINVTGTLSLIHDLTAQGVKVIFTSTDVVFGGYLSVANDDSPQKPFGYYGEMKAEVEKAVADNRLVKVIRFSYVMGPGDNYTSMLLEKSAEGETLEVFDGFERNVVALQDVIEGIEALIEKWEEVESEAINFGGPELVSRFELTSLFAKYQCPELKFEKVEAPEGFWKARPKKIEIDSPRFASLLGRSAMRVEDNLKEWNK